MPALIAAVLTLSSLVKPVTAWETTVISEIRSAVKTEV